MVKLDRCVASCNTVNDLSNKVCVPNKTEDLNLSVFNMITGINESKILTKDISCECKCRFDGKIFNSNQWWNNKCLCECKKVMYVKKIIFGIILHVVAKMHITCAKFYIAHSEFMLIDLTELILN